MTYHSSFDISQFGSSAADADNQNPPPPGHPAGHAWYDAGCVASMRALRLMRA